MTKKIKNVNLINNPEIQIKIMRYTFSIHFGKYFKYLVLTRMCETGYSL